MSFPGYRTNSSKKILPMQLLRKESQFMMHSVDAHFAMIIIIMIAIIIIILTRKGNLIFSWILTNKIKKIAYSSAITSSKKPAIYSNSGAKEGEGKSLFLSQSPAVLPTTINIDHKHHRTWRVRMPSIRCRRLLGSNKYVK